MAIKASRLCSEKKLLQEWIEVYAKLKILRFPRAMVSC